MEAESSVPPQQTEGRILSGTPIVMMQVVPQDVAGSITVESVTPDGNVAPVDSTAVQPAAGSPHSSLSSVVTDTQVHDSGFTLFRTNDLFSSGCQPGNSVEHGNTPDSLPKECEIADSEKRGAQHSQCLWQENPEYSGNGMCICFRNNASMFTAALQLKSIPYECADLALMRPQIDSGRDTASSTAATDSMPCSRGSCE